MKLRILTPISGPLFNLDNGDEYDFEDADAGRLIAAGFAEAVAVAKPTEKAVKAPPAETR